MSLSGLFLPVLDGYQRICLYRTRTDKRQDRKKAGEQAEGYINLNMQDVQQHQHKTSAVNVLCLGISFPNCKQFKDTRKILNESRENGS